MLYTLMAEIAPPPTATPTDAMVQLITLVLLFAGMYFLVIAPQREKQKEQDKLIKELKKGDEVITLGGIYGKVAEISETTVKLKIAEGVIIQIERNAIAGKPTTPEKKA
jgi:preprotein translocase subunit YajC